ncbi:hypothetical protein C8R44DRAFT_775214 [Mycena epipterygia]|nr:hypothetical protein C8R44DRAFT_775214 [Mycena epipterygia]
MFNKSALLFFALVVSSVVAVPVPKLTLRACDAATLQDNISQMADVANQILSVGFVLPDPFRSDDARAATFDTVVQAIADAGTAAASNDFATVSSKISFVDDTVSGLLDGLVADGLESSIDLNLADLADATKTLAAACT